MYRLYVVLSVLSVISIGIVTNYIKLNNLTNNIKLTEEYMSYLKKYYESNGSDVEAYSWLVYKSVRMQNMMGWLGIIDYKPPGAGYMVRNYQVIVNMLSELNSSFETDRFMSTFSLSNKYYSMLSEALVRYLGVISDNKDSRLRKMMNPFIDFRDGVQVVISFPLYLLKWFGFGGNRLTNSRVYVNAIKTISSFVALISFISAIVSLFVGWNDFLKIVNKLINT